MWRIQRRAHGDVVFAVSGRLGADNVGELSTLLAAEPSGRTVVLDLTDVVLVDQDVVRFLRSWKSEASRFGTVPYIRAWIVREEEQT